MPASKLLKFSEVGIIKVHKNIQINQKLKDAASKIQRCFRRY